MTERTGTGARSDTARLLSKIFAIVAAVVWCFFRKSAFPPLPDGRINWPRIAASAGVIGGAAALGWVVGALIDRARR